MKSSRPRVGLMVLALVVVSCVGDGIDDPPVSDTGGDTTTQTSATVPSSSAPMSTDGLASPAVEDCERLAEVELGEVTTVSAFLVTSGSAADQVGLPEFCRVALTVDPAVNIELWLPTDGYNSRFQGVGGGGYAGAINFGSMAEALRAGYATASTDTGHVGQDDLDGSFALSADGALNMPLIEDFASRSLIQLTEKSESLIEEFYGESADYAYWNGCSTGGREGLMLAQRYPEGYDGILAGAPAINWERFIPALLWPQIVMNEELGAPVEACKLAEATNAAVEACDALDGVSDGILDDPRECDFDPISLVGIDMPCGVFTETDAAVIQSIWDGPRSSDGEFLWYGLAPGAPLDAVAGSSPFPIGLVHHQAWVQQDPAFDWHTLGYEGFEDAFRTSQELFHDVIGTDDPDLSSFRDAGGKVLMWHGWYDELIFPEGTIDYYERVLDTMGDPQDVAEFARLFMVPGMFHCGGGPGLTEFDGLDALVDWVETGQAPEAITASRVEGGEATATRPLCPYPTVANYDGTGDPDQASSFDCTQG
jgi:pimeloyl-ACP methyl ester carboxylesterase